MNFFPRRFNQLFITWFGCGRVPIAPGTMGSIGALPLVWILASYTDVYFRLVFAVGFTALACLGSAQDQASGGKRDPQYIVVDEVAGMLWSTILITIDANHQNYWPTLLAAFVLFRIFDILKPPPALFFDRWSKTSTSTMRRGAHIVLDDVFAGLYALALIEVARHFSLLQ